MPHRLLAGGGEMGALMRALDWSATPVGPVQSWPQSLRTAVSILLESRFPMYIAWGREFTQFYNDGFRPILGSTKHPQALGTGTRETFTEIWPTIEPMFEDVMRGKAVGFQDLCLSLDRHGYLEECYFTFSYSPIRDESGDVGGVHVTVSETTERVLGERRMRTLRDLAARTIGAESEADAWARAAEVLADNAADIPFAILYALDDDEEHGTRVAVHGLEPDDRFTPRRIALADGAPWPLGAALRSDAVVQGLRAQWGDRSVGVWDENPDVAVIQPLLRVGHEDRPHGFLVAGVNARREFDPEYRDFFDLLGGQLAAALANSRAYAEERRRAESLAELDRAKTVFFSNVSHEFRTPLTLMLGPTEDLMADENGALAPGQRRQLEIIHHNSRRLLRLVNTLLDFSRIEAGRIDARFAPTDLAALTRALASTFRSAFERAGLEFEVTCDELPEPVWVDTGMWERVVLNLLSNALKFTLEGGVGVALRWTGDGVELEVTDTGVGIPETELPNVFKRFHRAPEVKARTAEGSGIGLALVHDLAHLHGGTVAVESVEGDGSVFRVRIPRGHAHLPQDKLHTESRQAARVTRAASFVEEALRWIPSPDANGTDRRMPPSAPVAAEGSPGFVAGASSGQRILLVDDNADLREYVGDLLSEHWRVETAADGREGLEKARSWPPDLVISDVMMPVMDGFELLDALRESPETSLTPVILLSARAGEESRIEGLERGADDYLVKPFSARELLARTRTHLELGALRRRLDAEQARFRALLMEAPAMFAITRGPDHVFELSNPLHRELTGNREVLGLAARQAFPELEGTDAFDLLARAYSTGERVIAREYPAPLENADGEIEQRWFDWVAMPLRDELKQVSGVMLFAYEVTEQVRARDAAEAATRAKDEFLAILGHELRNPLAPIVTALEIMRLKNVTAFGTEREIIERQVGHLARLVDDLLDVSRITRGRIELRREAMELSGPVRSAIEMASPIIEERGHRLSLDAPDTGLTVLADEHRLVQVIANLLTNAAKYTDPGGDIRVSATVDAGSAVVAVEDTGRGFEEHEVEGLFGMFSRASSASTRPADGGLGLGLMIVRSLVELHGGSVHAQSPGRGRGSRFEIRLPLAEGDPATEAPDARAEDTIGRRIMVVDDNRDAAEALAEILRMSGHETAVAHDGPAALELDSEFGPEVVLLDIGLPAMDGYEVAQRLRQQRLEDVPVLIAVTGYGQANDRDRSRAAGFDSHMVKPVDTDGMLRLIDELAGGR